MRRGAILGLGNVALHGHVPGWLGRIDVEIVAAADARPSQRAECQALLPRACWYDSPEELLEREKLDFVDICTPPSSHAPLILRALDRGLHVLSEKPLVSSPADLRRRGPDPGRGDRPRPAYRVGDAPAEARGGRRRPRRQLACGSRGGGRRRPL